ncbi:MAG: excinuclease ABC subunit UvrC [Gaiellaceae bacterium]|jgi:excinuclease ABC subunit C
MTRPLNEQLHSLPSAPGVYLFHDVDGEVLYVGKAKSLRPRVRSYFQRGGDARPGIAQLAARVAEIETIVTRNEVEALHLEQNLVKRHRPPFNVRLRDDKSFPYIAVTAEDEFPRVMFTRERHRRGVLYFGPYANAKKVRNTLDVLNRAFRFRPCEGPKPGRRSGIPCLDYHIDRCYAPCVGLISREEYGDLVDGVVEFLSGKTKPIQERLERSMRQAADEQRFEEAARYRNRLVAVRHLLERQAADRPSEGNVDVLGLAVEGERAAVQVFPLRSGRMVDRYAFELEGIAGQDASALIEAFCLEYYSGAPTIPPLVIVPPATSGLEAIAAYLSELRGAKVELRAPARGEKRRLQELVSENARLALASEAHAREAGRLRRIEALEQLREALNLESLPIRIECFDVSNLQEASPVASMVVFRDGLPHKAHYRKFALRTLAGQSDVGGMKEAIGRRFARLGELGETEYDESFATLPNLVVVDGGKGQLRAALAAMSAAPETERIAAVSLAKREEEVFVPGVARPVRLARHSAGLQLLQRLRDEAHRFAVGYHRQRRSSESFASLFDELRGVGDARRRAILRHFGSPERFLSASAEELAAVPGLPGKTARQIYAQLHKTGGA